MTQHKNIPDKLYREIHKTMPIPCVDFVLLQDGKVLLGQRTNEPAKGLWWFPGGRVQKGETLEEAVERKARQELGIEVKAVKKLGVDETIFDKGPFGWPTHTINVVFLAKPKGRMKLVLDDQHSEFRWLSPKKSGLVRYVRKYIALAASI